MQKDIRELEKELSFQKRLWKTQRIGWITTGLLLLAAVLGLLGSGGPLNETELHSADGRVLVSYDRFIRFDAPGTLRIKLPAQGSIARLWLDKDYLNALDIQWITPGPLRVSADSSGLTYEFAPTAPGTSLPVEIKFQTQTVGSLQGRLRLEDGTILGFTQFSYP
ncbi:hypothetical protein [Thermithiobacillus plumbiphilus]|uniref:DUF4968 domain-containing protein n=1 Tax=Thermithiobacillus plumbiphilus TaxID=1729899 RepID=A0ABU9DA23_9PROT